MNMLRNSGSTLLVIFVVAMFAAITYITVDLAKGGLSPSNSNTPNATVPGPPAFR